jgi:hypothetical protein
MLQTVPEELHVVNADEAVKFCVAGEPAATPGAEGL